MNVYNLFFEKIIEKGTEETETKQDCREAISKLLK